MARYPVPTFYLGLNNRGKLHKEWLYEVDSVKNLWKQTVYIVPKDLMVYIIDAKDGFFGKKKSIIFLVLFWENGHPVIQGALQYLKKKKLFVIGL